MEPNPNIPKIIGRTAQQDYLRKLLLSDRTQSKVVLVHGQPGIGKSFLLKAFLQSNISKQHHETAYPHQLMNFRRETPTDTYMGNLLQKIPQLKVLVLEQIQTFLSPGSSESLGCFLDEYEKFLAPIKGFTLILVLQSPERIAKFMPTLMNSIDDTLYIQAPDSAFRAQYFKDERHNLGSLNLDFLIESTEGWTPAEIVLVIRHIQFAPLRKGKIVHVKGADGMRKCILVSARYPLKADDVVIDATIQALQTYLPQITYWQQDINQVLATEKIHFQDQAFQNNRLFEVQWKKSRS